MDVFRLKRSDEVKDGSLEALNDASDVSRLSLSYKKSQLRVQSGEVRLLLTAQFLEKVFSFLITFTMSPERVRDVGIRATAARSLTIKGLQTKIS